MLALSPLPTHRKIRAILVDIVSYKTSFAERNDMREEMLHLSQSVQNIEVIHLFTAKEHVTQKGAFGKGKIADLALIIHDLEPDLILLSSLAKPQFIVELQQMFHTHVWDKIDLILYIFQKHAKTNEAKLQIQLAQLKHQIPRIYAYQSTTLFERSGSGTLARGSGESGIESEKRHIRKMIKQIEDKLSKYDRIRENQRKHRQQKSLPTVAIVGYTNAGKSTFLKACTKKDVYVADQLFATLDTRIGRLWTQRLQQHILFTDTIGFIRDIPPFLIESFQSTLRETLVANLILHVFDGSDPLWKEKIAVTKKVLQDIGADDIPCYLVANKSDRGCPIGIDCFHVSSFHRKTFEPLLDAIENFFMHTPKKYL